MIVSVEIPDGIARQLHLDGPEAQRLARERLVLDGYRTGELSRGQVSELLGLSFHETEALIKQRGYGQSLSYAEYQEQSDAARAFRSS